MEPGTDEIGVVLDYGTGDAPLPTPPADRGVLEGVTRQSVFDACDKNGIPWKLQIVPVEMVYAADEIFMCTTAGGVMPITILDGQPVGNGKIGPLTTKIWNTYWAMHWDPKYTLAVNYSSSKL